MVLTICESISMKLNASSVLWHGFVITVPVSICAVMLESVLVCIGYHLHMEDDLV